MRNIIKPKKASDPSSAWVNPRDDGINSSSPNEISADYPETFSNHRAYLNNQSRKPSNDGSIISMVSFSSTKSQSADSSYSKHSDQAGVTGTHSKRKQLANRIKHYKLSSNSSSSILPSSSPKSGPTNDNTSSWQLRTPSSSSSILSTFSNHDGHPQPRSRSSRTSLFSFSKFRSTSPLSSTSAPAKGTNTDTGNSHTSLACPSIPPPSPAISVFDSATTNRSPSVKNVNRPPGSPLSLASLAEDEPEQASLPNAIYTDIPSSHLSVDFSPADRSLTDSPIKDEHSSHNNINNEPTPVSLRLSPSSSIHSVVHNLSYSQAHLPFPADGINSLAPDEVIKSKRESRLSSSSSTNASLLEKTKNTFLPSFSFSSTNEMNISSSPTPRESCDGPTTLSKSEHNNKSSPSLTTLVSAPTSPSLSTRALNRIRRKTVSILFPNDSSNPPSPLMHSSVDAYLNNTTTELLPSMPVAATEYVDGKPIFQSQFLLTPSLSSSSSTFNMPESIPVDTVNHTPSSPTDLTPSPVSALAFNPNRVSSTNKRPGLLIRSISNNVDGTGNYSKEKGFSNNSSTWLGWSSSSTSTTLAQELNNSRTPSTSLSYDNIASALTGACLGSRPRSKTLPSSGDLLVKQKTTRPITPGINSTVGAAVPAATSSFPSLAFGSRPSLSSLIPSKFKNDVELYSSSLASQATVFQRAHSQSPVPMALGSNQVNAINGSPGNTTSSSGTSVSMMPVVGVPPTTSVQTGNAGSLATVAVDLTLPERSSPEETPGEYLLRIKDLGGSIAARLSTKDDPFFHKALEIFLSKFDFFGDPIDMSLRKFLMSVLLPKETQQIDRVLEAFSDRYYECNHDIFDSAEIAYIVTFSLVILHTDFFNKSNKRKMSKTDFIKNTSIEGVPREALECFYDNITYTPFIHTEEDCSIVSSPSTTRLSRIRRGSTFRPSNMVDPYALILEGRLDDIRPSLSPILLLKDPYNYLDISSLGDFLDLRTKFIDGPFLQLVSPRSRPAAFVSPDTTADPQQTDPGVIDIKVAKVGILMRSEAKRMITSKTIWKEWGALLTSSQLYLFKDTSWIKDILKRQQAATKANKATEDNGELFASDVTNDNDGTKGSFEASSESCTTAGDPQRAEDKLPSSGNIIRAPMEGFHPTVVIPTNEMVALTTSKSSSTAKRHKFIIVSRGGTQDTFAVTNEEDRQEWMSIINYSGSFNTFHINILGITGNKGEVHEDQLINKRHLMRPLRRASSDSSLATNFSDSSYPEHPLADPSVLLHSPRPGKNVTLASESRSNNSNGNNVSHRLKNKNSFSSSSLILALPKSSIALRHDMKFINDFHESRLSLISSKLSELEAKLSQQQAQLDSYLQISQHMRILAPIQQRTRENLIFSAGSLSAKIDWLWLERKRNLAYWDILSREQEVERLICANTMALDNNSIVSASTRRLSIQSDLASILTSVPPKIAFEQASVLSSTLMRHGSGTSNVANATETNSSGFKAEEASGIHDKSNEDIRHYNENYGEYDDDDYDDDDADYTMARMDQNDSDNFEDEKDFLGDILPGTTENGESAISLSRNRFSVISTQESIYYDPETGDAPIYGSGERINIIDQAVQHPKFSSKKPMLASVSHSGSTTSLPSLPMKESRKDMKLHPRLSAQNSSSSLSTSFHKLTKEYQTTDPFAGFPSTLNITRDDIEPSSRDDDYNNSLIDTISDSRKSSEDNGFITDLSDRTDSLETELSGTDELNEISDVKRNPSLIRQDSADFTVKGKKFSLVEVNPNFGSLQNHKRTMSQNLNNPVYQKSNISKGSDSSIPLMR